MPIRGHVADAGLDQLLGTGIGQVAAVDADHATVCLSQSGDRLRHLLLAVARDPRETQDLPGRDREAEAPKSGKTAVVQGLHAFHPENLVTQRLSLGEGLEPDLAAHHQVGQVLWVGVHSQDRAHVLATPQHGDAVGDRHHLVQLVRDEDDGMTLRPHRLQGGEKLPDLLRRQDGGRLVEKKDSRAPEEDLENLDSLLLTDGELPDCGRSIDFQAVLLGQLAHLLLRLSQVQRFQAST